MITKILNFFFGCRHRHTTWPRLDLNKGAYVVCLKCGNEMLYKNYELPIYPAKTAERLSRESDRIIRAA